MKLITAKIFNRTLNLYAISHLNLSSDVERVAREHLDYLRSRLESLSVVDEVIFDDCDKRKTDFLILYKKLTTNERVEVGFEIEIYRRRIKWNCGNS